MIYDDTNLCLLFIVDPTQSRVDFYEYFATQQVANYINNPNEDGSKTASNGVFGALQLVRDYEVDNFGLVATDLTNTIITKIRAFSPFFFCFLACHNMFCTDIKSSYNLQTLI